jgi:hypothetical protein
MNRMLRLAGITAVLVALTGAIAAAGLDDAPSTFGPHPAQVTPDPARAGVEASSGELEPVGWARAETRRTQSVAVRVDALLLPAGVLAAALLALGAVTTAARRRDSHLRRPGFRRRAPPLLLPV